MNKKVIIATSTSIILLSGLIGCSANKTELEKTIETKVESMLVKNAKPINYNIEEKVYKNKDIKIKYPQINGLGNDEKQDAINNIIKKKAISIYDATIKDLEEGVTYEVDGSYEIKLMNNDILSIAYTSYNNVGSSAYPYNLFYTTNMNIKKGKELATKDIIPKVDNKFITLLKSGKYVGSVEKEYQEQLMKFVYGNYPDPEDLIDVVKNAYVYITEDSIGVSIPAPHVAGDYVPIEIKKDNLKNINLQK